MVSPGATLIRENHGMLRRLDEIEGYVDTIMSGETPAGRHLDLAIQPAGILVLGAGQAVVEYGPRPAPPKRPTEFEFGGIEGIAPDLRPGVTRWLLGAGDQVLVGGYPPFHRVRDARIYCVSTCEWIFVPAMQEGDRPLDLRGRDALSVALRDRALLDRGRLVLKLTRFAKLSHLSFDAVRHLASFFEVKRYDTGEVVFAVGELTRATIVLEGRLTGTDVSVAAGGALFGEALTGGPGGVPVPSLVEVTARGRTVTAELPHALAANVQTVDARLSARHDIRWTRQWNAVVGDADEAAPDAQTLALNLAAREGTTQGPLAPALPVLVIDADGLGLVARAQGSMLLSGIEVVSTWPLGLVPRSAFGPEARVDVVGLKAESFTHRPQVDKLLQDIGAWQDAHEFHGKIVFRIPRHGMQWRPVVERSISVDVVVDDLMDPLPEAVDPLMDIVRVARPRENAPFRSASRVPFVAMPRREEPTTRFWRTGVPWTLES